MGIESRIIGIDQSGKSSRCMPKEPSPDIEQLVLLQPNIFATERGRLCSMSPINILGAMVLEVHKDEILRGYYDNRLFIPRSLSRPVKFAQKVPVYFFDPDSTGYRNTDLVADTVMIKQTPGPHVGVVLTGPLAGLLLDTKDGAKTYTKGMCINRVWNDEALSIQGRQPYNPIDEAIFEHRPLSTRIRGLFEKRTQWPDNEDFFDDQTHLFYELWQNAISGSQADSSLAMFFWLCEQLEIPVEHENFHFTRELPVQALSEN